MAGGAGLNNPLVEGAIRRSDEGAQLPIGTGYLRRRARRLGANYVSLETPPVPEGPPAGAALSQESLPFQNALPQMFPVVSPFIDA